MPMPSLQIIYLQETVFDPMVVPPLPWRGVFFGGQLLQNDTVVRVKSSKAQMEALRRRDREGPGLSKVKFPPSSSTPEPEVSMGKKFSLCQAQRY